MIIQDIDDGTICESLRAEGAFLSCPEHAGLILCTDGVPVFKSSGFGYSIIMFNFIVLYLTRRSNIVACVDVYYVSST